MRYVILFAVVGFFLAWDILYNQGQYIDAGTRFLSHMVRQVTG